ncbi:MATE family efflux transporter, partial [Sutterella sp.]|uniref:MATE family efflux transporter n=1 Tax=Sutterella sp. TaxID=1981025 RepID=UPI003FD6C053
MPDRERFAQHFTAPEHLAFAAPRMAMSLLVMSYLVADGVLVARFVGMTGLSAVSMTFPITSAMMAVGVMVAAGCGEVAARRLGARDRRGALEAFATAASTNLAGGAILGGVVLAVLPDVCGLLGMTAEQSALALEYQGVLLCGTGLFLLNFVFQTFFTVAARPKAGLAAAAAVGVLNIVLDLLFKARLSVRAHRR